jgi:hypothetical protein
MEVVSNIENSVVLKNTRIEHSMQPMCLISLIIAKMEMYNVTALGSFSYQSSNGVSMVNSILNIDGFLVDNEENIYGLSQGFKRSSKSGFVSMNFQSELNIDLYNVTIENSISTYDCLSLYSPLKLNLTKFLLKGSNGIFIQNMLPNIAFNIENSTIY